MKPYFVFISLFIYSFSQAQLVFHKEKVMSNVATSEGVEAADYADLDGDGDMDILVCDKFNLKWIENTGNTENQFVEHNLLSEHAVFISAVDIDGDDDLDILAATSFEIFFFLNSDGSGSYGEPQEIFSAVWNDEMQSMDSADLDGDNDIDVVFRFKDVSENDYYFGWLENLDNEGNFLQHTLNENLRMYSLELADADGDGDFDMFNTFGSSSYKDHMLYLNDGEGNFTSELIAENLWGARYIFPADFDQDGFCDFFSLTGSGNEILWFKNIGGLEYELQPTILTEVLNMSDFNFGDIDGDGDLDVVFSSFDNDILAYMQYDGSADSFSMENIIAGDANGANSVAFEDFDTDGDLDILSSSFYDDKIALYENSDGIGNFSTPVLLTQSFNYPARAEVGDLDGDGDSDILSFSLADDKLAWYPNTDGLGNFGIQRQVTTDLINCKQIDLADVDSDGDLDILLADHNGNSGNHMEWFENNEGEFTAHVIDDGLSATPALGFFDFDSDGDFDIIFAQSGTSELYSFENLDGFGNFGNLQVIIDTDEVASELLNVRINSDEYDDILMRSFDGSISWYAGTSSGVFASESTLVSQGTSETIKNIDIDSDGDFDLVYVQEVSSISSEILWKENLDGEGNFGSSESIYTGLDGINTIFGADVDSDGDTDILVGADAKVSLLTNYDGFGTTWIYQPIEVNEYERNTIALGDLNADGNIDMFCSQAMDGYSDSYALDSLVWFRNSGPLLNTIEGNVIIDSNLDGCTALDDGIEDFIVTADDGTDSYSSVTGPNGHYQILVGEGIYESSIVTPLPDYYSYNPNSISIEFTQSGLVEEADFCLEPTEVVTDVSTTLLPIGDAIPGFDANYWLLIENNGTVESDGEIQVIYDSSRLTFLFAEQEPTEQSLGMLTFDYDTLAPLESRVFEIGFNLMTPPINNSGDVLNFIAEVIPIEGDVANENNVFSYDQVIINAYDPNDITCMEGNAVWIEESDEYLHFRIRFQNTGTANAQRVEVLNVLDEKLDWSTFEPTYISHDYEVEIAYGNELNFIFDAIYLPDSTSDETNSHGFIHYRILPREDVEIGDIIYNSAAIYFDFNLPIFTNTSETEFVENTLGISEQNDSEFRIYPSPAKDMVNISTVNLYDEILIYDLQGRLLKRTKGDATIVISDLSSGTYILEIRMSDQFIQAHKFIKR